MKKNLLEQKTLIIGFFLFLNIIIMSTNIVLKDNKTLLEYSIGAIISPIQILVGGTTNYIESKWEKYFFSKNIYQQYQALKRQIFTLKNRNYLLKQDIKRLKSQLKISQTRSDKYKIVSHARVIYIDRNYLYNFIIINSGSIHKVKKDMIVVNDDFELVGKIMDSVTPLTSRVRLITSKIGGVGAYISNNQMEGFLTGNNSKVCSFKYLIESKPIRVGDKVYTSGTDGLFPDELPIGTVKFIKKGYLEQSIQISPYFIKKPINSLIILERL